MKQHEIVKRDNCLIKLLSEHKGQDNAILGKDIVTYLSANGFIITQCSLRSLISKLRQERILPILYTSHGGYYWANSQTEIKERIRECQAHIDGTQEYINLLKKFVIE